MQEIDKPARGGTAEEVPLRRRPLIQAAGIGRSLNAQAVEEIPVKGGRARQGP